MNKKTKRREGVASCWLLVASKRRPRRRSQATSNEQLATSPRAFTLIELLTVIGIIVLLASMLFLAYDHVTTSTSIRDTKTALETAKTLFDNYKQATHLNKPLMDLSNTNQTVTVIWPATNTQVGTWAPDRTNLTNYWSVGYEAPSTTIPLGETAPGAITIDALTAVVTATGAGNIYAYPYPATDPVKNAILPPNTLPQQLVDTICVMYTLEQLPDNKAIIANLPTQRKMTLPLVITSTTTSRTSVTLLLDGWGNPILFVPAIGLYGVETSSAVDNYIGSVKYSQGDQVIDKYTDNTVTPPKDHYYFNTWISTTAANTAPPSPPPPSAGSNWGGLCAPGLRHYWVSGGPDGNISTHDDNLYSFQD